MRWSRAVRTFEHEAAMLERCAHEQVVRLFDLYQGPRDLSLVLEYIPGGDMQQLLQRHGALAENAVNAIILQLATALQHVHKCDVLHRDVKLENLLVVRPGASPIIKLCDFGHAAFLAHADDGFTGTVGYAAPEVSGASRERPPEWSAAADRWSMGVVMYAVLANAPLQWARDGPDFSLRPLVQTSTKAKLLIRALLAVPPGERCSLDHATRVLADPPDVPSSTQTAGMRRGLGSGMSHSYSLLDVSSLDKEHVPRAAACVSMPSGTASLSSDGSYTNLLSPNTSFSNLLTPSSGTLASLSEAEPTGASSAAAAVPAAAATARARAGVTGVMCQKESWRGIYARQLCVDDDARSVSTVDPSTGRVTNRWRFDQILAVVDDERRDGGSGSGGGAPTGIPSGDAARARGFSLLIDGAANPPLLCLGGWLSQRLRFVVSNPAERSALLSKLQAAAGLAAPLAAPAPVLSRPPSARCSRQASALVAAAFPAGACSSSALTPAALTPAPTPSQSEAMQQQPQQQQQPPQQQQLPQPGPKPLSPQATRRASRDVNRTTPPSLRKAGSAPSVGGSPLVSHHPPAPAQLPPLLDLQPQQWVGSAGGVASAVGYTSSPAGLLEHGRSHGGLQPPTAQFSSMGARGMSCGSLESMGASLTAPVAPGSGQEEQLRRMRDRFNAMRAGSAGSIGAPTLPRPAQ